MSLSLPSKTVANQTQRSKQTDRQTNKQRNKESNDCDDYTVKPHKSGLYGGGDRFDNNLD
jgi:hypothetical protein